MLNHNFSEAGSCSSSSSFDRLPCWLSAIHLDCKFPSLKRL
jgi:hypothetical protein